MIPRFDFWFWLLVGWAFFAPYLFEQAHMRACKERGTISLEAWPWTDPVTFKCERVGNELDN